MQTVQSAVIAAVGQIVALIVAFGVMNNTLAGAVVSASTALVGAGFVVAQAIENHGKAS